MSASPIPTLTLVAALLGSSWLPSSAGAQSTSATPTDADPATALPQDLGPAGLYQALKRLTTTASLMQTTAHPDDEQSAVLTLLSRGDGVRVSLLTLNRGEGGANALGDELFDGLGAIRTEELLLAGRHYGLAQQYFTTAVDYGFSKTLDEALSNWGREAVLEDMVRIIRRERPTVVVSRFHGSERDGHGHHQAAGVLTPEAVRAAADPSRFPEQLTQGLRPWKAVRLFRGGVGEEEPVHVSITTDKWSPWLGTTYAGFASIGLSLQRSQTAGRIRTRGPGPGTPFELLAGPAMPAGAGVSADGFFGGLNTALSGVLELTGEEPEPVIDRILARAESHVTAAIEALDIADLTAVVPHVARALDALRTVHGIADARPDAQLLIGRKIHQAEDALRLATGTTLRATVDPGEGTSASTHRIAPGDEFGVRVEVHSQNPKMVSGVRLSLDAPSTWQVAPGGTESRTSTMGGQTAGSFRVRLPGDAASKAQYFSRASPRESRYAVQDSTAIHRPWGLPPLSALATLAVSVDGESIPFGVESLVRGEEPNLPRGIVRRMVRVVSPVSVSLDPAVRLSLTGRPDAPLRFEVRVQQGTGRPVTGRVRLEVPVGWTALPASSPLTLEHVGETATLDFEVTPDPGFIGKASVRAVAVLDGRSYSESEQSIRYPDLEERTLRAPAVATVQRVDVQVAPGLRIGYVMGVGDDVPAAIRELGAQVELLDTESLTALEPAGYDAVIIGTRAYAVRPELYPLNATLLDYVSQGGHLIVLYQTQEYDPAILAPFPAVLPRRAEEVSEEDAPVRLLAPEHPQLLVPNPITGADFEEWIEQRGSKFFSEWDPAFTPLVETHDQGQAPQQGVWLTAAHGDGHYTYVSLALQRQTPYGVPGAYRILANLLSYGVTR